MIFQELLCRFTSEKNKYNKHLYNGEYCFIAPVFFCHWLGDFTPLSVPWMIRAKERGKPLFPIFCHALVHAILMGAVLFVWISENFFQPELIAVLFLFQLVTHFAIDVWKGKMNVWFPVLADRNNKFHWMLFGMDQFFHATVIIVMVHYLPQ